MHEIILNVFCQNYTYDVLNNTTRLWEGGGYLVFIIYLNRIFKEVWIKIFITPLRCNSVEKIFYYDIQVALGIDAF